MFGAFLSCVIAAIEIVLLVFQSSAELTWISAALLAFGALLPTALFGLPYLDSRFAISYSKTSGLTIAEEKVKTEAKVKKENEREV
jgi:hypothetical protein